MSFPGRARLDRQGVDAGAQILGKDVIDEPVPGQTGLADEGVRHHLDVEMCFAGRHGAGMSRRGMADMARMLVGLVDHFQRDGRKRGRQLAFDSLLRAHALFSIPAPPGASLRAIAAARDANFLEVSPEPRVAPCGARFTLIMSHA